MDTPVMWLGLLFSMICLATRFQKFLEDEPRRMDQPVQPAQGFVRIYRQKVAQCLVLGNYTKSVPFTIETLVLYFMIEHFNCEDTQVGTWILLGIIVRTAMRMGYHRDASHYPRISPFHAEMRRRSWAMIVQLDLITSSQVGLSRMIKPWQSDTAEPRNILDDDFDEDLTELPTPRPDTDLTPMVYFLMKNKLLSVCATISDLTASTRPPSYAGVMRMDQLLHEARRAIPPGLQLRPISKSITHNSDIVIKRIYLALVFHNAQRVLHRKYLLPARSNTQYAYSRQSCVEGALQILQHQSTLNQETQPGGQLYRDRWKVSSLVNHYFLLAATILCLDLDRSMMAGSSTCHHGEAMDSARDEKVIQALHESYRIWLQSSSSSREAQKAVQVLKIMLGKARKSKDTSTSEFSEEGFDLSVSYNNTFELPTGMLLYVYKPFFMLISAKVASISPSSSLNPSVWAGNSTTPTNHQSLESQTNTLPPRGSDYGSTFDHTMSEFDWVIQRPGNMQFHIKPTNFQDTWDPQYQTYSFGDFPNAGDGFEMLNRTFPASASQS